MAEWVLKGSLKGPQGDPGADAELPEGGTEGQVLTKTSGGEAWADVPQPDMTGVVKAEGESEKTLKVDGGTVDAISLLQGITIGQSSTFSIRDIGNQLQALAFSAGDGGIGNVAITCEPGSAGIQIGTIAERVTFGFYQNGPAFSLSRDKSVSSITDAIADSPAGSALVTDKAVKDYVDAHGVTIPVPISQGGTGATTADGARTALGISVADPDELVEYIKSKLGGA